MAKGPDRRLNDHPVRAEAGDLEVEPHMNPYPRMQLVTVPDIFEGKRFRTPGAVGCGSPQFDGMTEIHHDMG